MLLHSNVDIGGLRMDKNILPLDQNKSNLEQLLDSLFEVQEQVEVIPFSGPS